MRIIDCSFRDGGYDTYWHFPVARVRSALGVLANYGVSHCELGFALPNRQVRDGPFANVNDHVLDSVQAPEGLQMGYMLEVKRHHLFDDLEAYAKWAIQGRRAFNFVRLATTIENQQETAQLARILAKSGLEVFVNLMQVSLLSSSEVTSFLKSDVNPQGKYVLADSFGSMVPTDTSALFDELVDTFPQLELGFHGHDNRGLAHANALAAAASGASWVDGTLAGHGRGSGNTKTEELLLVEGESRQRIMASPWLLGTHLEAFEYDRQGYRKEGSLAFHIAAILDVHPNELMSLLESSKSLGFGDFLELLTRNSSLEPRTVDVGITVSPIQGKQAHLEGHPETWRGKCAIVVGRSSNRPLVTDALELAQTDDNWTVFLNEGTRAPIRNVIVVVTKPHMFHQLMAFGSKAEYVLLPESLRAIAESSSAWFGKPPDIIYFSGMDEILDDDIIEFALRALALLGFKGLALAAMGHDSNVRELVKTAENLAALEEELGQAGISLTSLDNADLGLKMASWPW